MKVDIVTLFPKMFAGPFDESIIKRAQEREIIEITLHDLRDFAHDPRRTVDERPYGGGAGMVIMVEPIYEAVQKLKTKDSKVILVTPQGQPFKQNMAMDLSKEKHLIFITGHYEGFDERIREHLVDMELSIGDYVLTGGELPTMVMVDAITRLIPGVLKKEEATVFETFAEVEIEKGKTKKVLEYPQYTKPVDFKGWKVPEILMGGNHPEIAKWKKEESVKRTRAKRPDLLE
jgi:tRNA (guanine37-N1)-methyltransferase